MLMYNGKVIFFGAANSRGHGKTAIYTLPASPTGTGTWAARTGYTAGERPDHGLQ